MIHQNNIWELLSPGEKQPGGSLWNPPSNWWDLCRWKKDIFPTSWRLKDWDETSKDWWKTLSLEDPDPFAWIRTTNDILLLEWKWLLFYNKQTKKLLQTLNYLRPSVTLFSWFLEMYCKITFIIHYFHFRWGFTLMEMFVFVLKH